MSHLQGVKADPWILSDQGEAIIQDIAANGDSDVRGHQIALAYHELGCALSELLEGDEQHCDAEEVAGHRRSFNWFHLATWATTTLLRNISNDRAPNRLTGLPLGSARRWVTSRTMSARAAEDQYVSRWLAYGQRNVFLSTVIPGRAFIRWLRGSPHTVPTKAWNYDHANWRRVWEQTGEVRDGVDEQRLRRYGEAIDRAFDCYRLARGVRLRVGAPTVSDSRRWADDMSRATRLICAGNILITSVEQLRVDETVTEAIDFSPTRWGRAAESLAARVIERRQDLPRQVAALGAKGIMRPVVEGSREVWARLMTEHLLVLSLPGETLRLGRDIPPRPRDAAFVPEPLRMSAIRQDIAELSGASHMRREQEALVLDELVAMITRVDRSAGDGRGTAAGDWRSFNARMNWALGLLRSRQLVSSMRWVPYQLEDMERIRSGKTPRRRGDPYENEQVAAFGRPAKER